MTTPTITDISHWVQLDNSAGHWSLSEDVVFKIDAEWRGKPVVADMRADRYTHSSGLSDWRVVCREATQDDGGGRRSTCTDLARQRLRDQLTPLVEEWLASDEYRPSEVRAYAWALKQSVHQLRIGGDALHSRALLEHWAAKVTPAIHQQLTELFDAWDAFDKLYDAMRF